MNNDKLESQDQNHFPDVRKMVNTHLASHQWFAEKTKDASLLWGQKKLFAEKSSGNVRNRILPAMLIWGSKTDLNSVKPPSQKLWVGQGPSP